MVANKNGIVLINSPFETLISQFSKHKLTIKRTVKNICLVAFSKVFVRKVPPNYNENINDGV